MTIVKANGGFVVKHCKGTDIGKRIAATKKPVTRAKAEAIHGAIQSKKDRPFKHQILGRL